MKDVIGQTVNIFMGFFAIMNPLANAPIFIALTPDADDATRRSIAFRAVGVAFVLIVAFSVVGKLIFELFGLTMPALRIVGGVLVSHIGLQMMQGQQSSHQTPNEHEAGGSGDGSVGVAISPLATPLLAGPGTIATAMNFAAGPEAFPIAMTIAAFGVLCVITFFSFVWGEALVRLLGRAAISVITRLMGLLLAVIGAQMLIEGIKGAFAIGGG